MNKIFILLIALFIQEVAAQSPWTPGKGKGYTQLGGVTISNYDQLFLDGTDTLDVSREISDLTMQSYSEVGLADRLAGILVVPLKVVSAGEAVSANPGLAQGSLVGLGNIQIGLRYAIWEGSGFTIGSQLIAQLPAWSEQVDTGLRTGLPAFTAIPSLSVGYGASRWYAYLALSSGIRGQEYSSEWRSSIEAGYKVWREIYLMLTVDSRDSFENRPTTDSPSFLETGLYVNNQEFFSGTFKIFAPISERFGAILNTTLFNFSGNYVPRAPAIGFSVFYRW